MSASVSLFAPLATTVSALVAFLAPLLLMGFGLLIVFLSARTVLEWRREGKESEALGREVLALQAQLRTAKEEQQAATTTLRQLYAVTEATDTYLSISELLHAVPSHVSEIVKADTVAVLLKDEGSESLLVRAAKGLEKEVECGMRIPIGCGFAGRVAAERRIWAVEDLTQIDVYSPILRNRGIKALLGAPLVINNSVIGVLHVGFLRPHRFTGEESQLLHLLSNQVVLALNHVRFQCWGRMSDSPDLNP